MKQKHSMFNVFKFLTLISCFLTFSAVTFAGEEVNVDEDNLALKGYDPVAYHLINQPIEGSSKYTSTFQGAEYYFTSAKNREVFMENPEKYIPAYGGYCAYGVRVGKKFDIDPEVWKIIDEKLYLQLDQGTQLIWVDETEKNISIADRLWESIEPIPAKDLELDWVKQNVNQD